MRIPSIRNQHAGIVRAKMPSKRPRTGLKDGPETSVARALNVLVMVADRQAARADELAEDIGLPVSTVYRYLRTLRAFDLVIQKDGVYTLGSRLHPLAPHGVSNEALRHLAQPVLEALVKETGETAVLAIRLAGQALCLGQVESPHWMRMAFRVPQLLPLHAGAASKVLLAYAPEDQIESILSSELERFTPNTPDRRELRQEVARIRAKRIAISQGEFISGAVAVAVPVLLNDQAICSLTVAGPAERCDAKWIRASSSALNRAGEWLSKSLAA
jgi:DNA-binding IclR family transcriptional regulator